MRAAGFWRRGAAWSLDATLVALPVLAAGWGPLADAASAVARRWDALVEALAQRMADAIHAGGPALASDPTVALGLARDWARDPGVLAAADALQSSIIALAAPPVLAFLALFFAWCVGFERSRMQATPGKRALALRVVDAAGGGRITMGKALLRFFAGSLSWLSLNLGHLLAALPPDHAALHDRLSGTRVVLAAHAPARMPAWAIGWLVLLAGLSVLATAWVAWAASAALQATLARVLWG
jgi:uncharacterized RDD family membrane protein YckC